MKKGKSDFGEFAPPTLCTACNGRTEVKDEYVSGGLFSSGYWRYKRCISCNGTGKNLYHCLTCKELMNGDFWCANQKCKSYNIKVGLVDKKD